MHRTLQLRISLTGRCAFACPYCQPRRSPHRAEVYPATPEHLPTDRHLTGTELGTIVAALVEMGHTRVRLTGGEPLARPDCVQIVEELSRIPGVRAVALTTNGERLAQLAPALAVAGLDRVNVHLDTLRPNRFARLGGRGELATVLEGIEGARRCGLKPVKVNTVLMRGLNDDELVDLCRFAVCTGTTVRFNELMDTGPARAFVRQRFLPVLEARATIERAFALSPRLHRGASPAREFLVDGGAGVIGFIASESRPFCSRCNRLRLTADGVLKGCLHQTDGVSLAPLLRGPAPDLAELRRALHRAVHAKRSCHPALVDEEREPFSMAQLGG